LSIQQCLALLEKPCQLHISLYWLKYWLMYHSYWTLCVSMNFSKLLCWVGLGTIDIEDISVIRISRSLVNGYNAGCDGDSKKQARACVGMCVCVCRVGVHVRVGLCVCCKLFCGSSGNVVTFFHIHVSYVTEQALTGAICYLAMTYFQTSKYSS
jgi:hypothetical protein